MAKTPSTRSTRSGRRSSRLTRRRRRRLTGAGVLVGTAIAAAGGWLVAASRPSAPPPPSPARAASTSGLAGLPPGLSLGPGAADPRIVGGRLEVPVVDAVEMLPTCHN